MHAVSLLFHDVYAADPRESGFASDAADRYKLSAADFDAQLRGLAGVRRDAPLLATEPGGLKASGYPSRFARGCAFRYTSSNCAAFTCV